MFEDQYVEINKLIMDLNGEIEGMRCRITDLATHREMITAVILSDLSDEEIIASQEILTWLFSEVSRSESVSLRARKIAQPRIPELTAQGFEGRNEYYKYYLPTISIRLAQNQEIEHVCAEIRRWAAIFGLSRHSLIIGIRERTLAEYGVWSMEYDQVKDIAQIQIRRWGNLQTEIPWTSLKVCLTFVAKSLYC
jgi:hypothetical protein